MIVLARCVRSPRCVENDKQIRAVKHTAIQTTGY